MRHIFVYLSNLKSKFITCKNEYMIKDELVISARGTTEDEVHSLSRSKQILILHRQIVASRDWLIVRSYPFCRPIPVFTCK